MIARRLFTALATAGLAAGLAAAPALADNFAAAEEVDGKFYTEEGVPTFNVTEDGTVDWYTFSGFRRYHAECHVCHGPDGQGSSYAPALARSAVNMDYYDFVAVVAQGKQNGSSVMPSFGTNQNVMCYIDDIYVYLKAVGAEAIPRGRPAQRAEKPQGATEAEDACMG
jgi:methanol metabolism-related c-type cytochrome